VRRMLVVALLALVTAPSAPASEDPFPRAVVVGIGNRVSGRIAVGIVGEEGCPWHVAFREAAKQIEARSDLRVAVTVGKRPPARPTLCFRSKRPPENGRSVEQAVEAIREFILHHGDVAYHRTAFAPLVHRLDGTTLHLEAKALLPGKVDMTPLTVEGKVLRESGPVRPIDLATLDDHAGILVRLRFEGENGLRDEVRYWLPDLLPGGNEAIRVEGNHDVPTGEPVLLRVAVAGPDWRARAGRPVTATMGDASASSVTDHAGTAVLTLPPLTADADWNQAFAVRVGEGLGARVLTGWLHHYPRPIAAFVETDRPAYRPGGDVAIRALVLDALARTARPGVPVRVEVRNPRRQLVAAFNGTTGEFGEATFSLPLALGTAEGDYRIVTKVADRREAGGAFRVEELVLPPLNVEVSFERDFFTPKDPFRATVRVSTFAGDPVAGATIYWSASGGPSTRREATTNAEGVAVLEADPLKADSYRPSLDLDVRRAGARVQLRRRLSVCPERSHTLDVRCEPAPLIAGVPGRIFVTLLAANGRPAAGKVKVRLGEKQWTEHETDGASVELTVAPAADATGVRLEARGTPRGGETATIDLYLACRRGGVIECDAVLAPGATAKVVYRTGIDHGPLQLDLYAAGRLVGVANSAPGSAEFALPVQSGLGGPALLVVRRRSGTWLDRREVFLGRADLAVILSVTPKDSAPGEEVVIDAAVRDRDGARRALLDVRGFDRAYLERVGGFTSAVPGFLHPDVETPGNSVIAEFDPLEPFVRLEERSRRATDRAMEKAADDPEHHGSTPWGAPILHGGDPELWRQYPRREGARIVTAEPAVTARPGREGEWPIAPITRVDWGHADGGRYGEILLPTGAPGPVTPSDWSGRRIKPSLSIWLDRHQSPDGSWRPYAFVDRCDGKGCEDRGDPRLHPGTTGLALLAYLGAGETHRHGGHRREVKSGLRYLKTIQGPAGEFGNPDSPWALLNHCMAALAMTEAYSMTGSPLFVEPAKKAVRQLISLQGKDGSFRERGFSRGSLVATGWATLVLRSATLAGLVDAKPALDRVRAWAFANIDTTTRIIPPTSEERAGYPFRMSAPGPAAITTMILVHTGTDPRRAGGELPAIAPPDESEGDLHSAWWGALAAFRHGGRTWSAYNRDAWHRMFQHQHRGGCGEGSWSPLGSPIGRIAATAFGALYMEMYYRYDRVFGSESGGSRTSRVRRDFLDLAVADLGVPTDAAGRARIPVTLPDDITTWDFVVGAWDGRGGYAVGRASVRSTLPLAIEGEMPERMTVGDRLVIPVRIRSRTDEERDVQILVETSENLEVVSGPAEKVQVPWQDVVATPVVLSATAPGPGWLRIRVTGEKYGDAWEKGVSVRSNRHPFAVTTLLTPGEEAGLGDLIPDDADRIRGRLELGLSPRDVADLALRGLIRRPSGCFEQTAAKLYPLLFAKAFLERTGLADPTLSAAARRHLLTGYQILIGYEIRGGGFSLYGEGDPDPALTALGIHLLVDLEREIAVDRRIVASAAVWLSKHIPEGGAARVYAVAALARGGFPEPPEGFRAWLGKQTDPYLLSLAAVHGLIEPGQRAVVRTALEKDPEENETATLFAGGAGSKVEATALRALALHRLGGDRPTIEDGIAAVRGARGADGAWPTTRATVAALRAILEVENPDQVRGRMTVLRGEGGPLVVDLQPRGVRTIDLGDWPCDRSVRVEFEGEGRPRVRLIVTGESEEPPPSTSDLELSVEWPEMPLRAGTPCRVPVTIKHSGRDPMHAPMVVVPVPAGFRVQQEKLKQLVEDSAIDLYQVRDGRVELYLSRLAPGQEVRLRLPLVPGFEGTVTPAPAQAYPYYRPHRFASAPGTSLTVK